MYVLYPNPNMYMPKWLKYMPIPPSSFSRHWVFPAIRVFPPLSFSPHWVFSRRQVFPALELFPRVKA